MANAADLLLDAAVRHGVLTSRYRVDLSDRFLRDVLGPLGDEVVAILAPALLRLRTRGHGVGPHSRRGLEVALDRADALVGERYRAAWAPVAAELRRFARVESAFWRARLPEVLPLAGLSFPAPADAELRAVVSSLQLAIGDHAGLPRSVYMGPSVALRRRLRGAVLTGVGQGDSAEAILAAIEGTRAREGVFGKADRETASALRTLVPHVSAHAGVATFAAARPAGLLPGVFLSPVLNVWSAGTRPASPAIARGMRASNRVQPLASGPRPPVHFQDRLLLSPVPASARALRLTGGAPAAGDLLDGRPPLALAYTSWLRRQPRLIRELALGRATSRAFDAGAEFTLRELLLRLNRPLSLDRLLRIEGLL